MQLAGNTTVTGTNDCKVNSGGYLLINGGTLNENTTVAVATGQNGSLQIDSGGVVDISGGSINVTGKNYNATNASSIMIGTATAPAGTMFIRGTAGVSASFNITMGVYGGAPNYYATGMLVVADSAQVTTAESVIIGGSQASGTGI